jgi:hypothetical protein
MANTKSSSCGSQTDRQDLMYARYNHDGRKDRDNFNESLEAVLNKIEKLYKSSEKWKVSIFRHRFVAHLVPNPRDLKHLPSSADVQRLLQPQIKEIVDEIASIIDHILFLDNRDMFPKGDIIHLTLKDCKELWP